MNDVKTGAEKGEDAGMFTFGYNRANYAFDMGMRFQRYNVGRKMAIARKNMFRQDVTDLATVTTIKMKIYAPIMTMSLGYCITIFVEGRSGLKFPGPPVFVSGIYLQCLGIAFGFLTLGVWLIFHASIRANIAAVSLRTRKVRLPVPTQQQLDGARRLLSTYEEQHLYDMFKLPLVMPNLGDAPEHTVDDFGEDAAVKGKKGDKMGAKGKKGAKGAQDAALQKPAVGVRLPSGTTSGNPRWIDKELEQSEKFPGNSPDTEGREGEHEPFEHFELMRQCQKTWWGAEAYSRICFLYGMMHLIHSFAYWLVLHNICELGMVWCANICGAALTAGIWSMFRLDVLADRGGCMPIEACGPLVAAMTLALMYTSTPTQTIIDASRAMAVIILIMHVMWTIRLFIVAMPTNGEPNHAAAESGGRLFNESASCQVPQWLPTAFQHVTYLIAPPKTKAQLEQEEKDHKEGLNDDPMHGVDMTPWLYVRTFLLMVILGWTVLIAGRIVECAMGERMLMVNPGAPPWSRVGQWYGWEFGAITSKHYAHVTPMQGHFSYQQGWGPQGQQEIWSSDMFGFHPEADAWWAEPAPEEGEELPAQLTMDSLVGAAGYGENYWHNWANYVEDGSGAPFQFHSQEAWDAATAEAAAGAHPADEEDDGGHRRLRGEMAMIKVQRPVVPVAVEWSKLLEPELLACGPGGNAAGVVAAVSSAGLGGIVPAEVAMGRAAGRATSFTLEGLVEHGMATGLSWAKAALRVVTGSGAIATCPLANRKGGTSRCSLLDVPALPFGYDPHVRATVVEGAQTYIRVAAASQDGQIAMFELRTSAAPAWQKIGSLPVPHEPEGDLVQPEISAITANQNHLLLTTKGGSTYQWNLHKGYPVGSPRRETPSSGPGRTWWSACSLPSGQVIRLASSWKQAASGSLAWHPELFL